MQKIVNCGIYAIINIINQKIYIGSSRDITERIKSHFCNLKRNNLDNKNLQEDFNTYGIENFKFEIISYCKEDNLNKKELFYIYYYNSFNPNCGYNLKNKNGRSSMSSAEQHL